MIRMAVSVFLLLTYSPLIAAQEFPTRSIKIVVPYAAGGPTDIAARLLANALAKTFNQSVVIENIGGAGGSIGTARVAASEADGYTLLFNNVSLGAGPFLQPNLSYDPIKDFEPIGVSLLTAVVLIARPDFPPANMTALLSYLKDNGKKVTFATSGLGGTSHLCQVLLLNAIGAEATSVAYRGSAPAINDVAAGQVDMLCDAVETAAPQINAGRVKAFGVTSIQRMSALPEVPTLDEQGLKGFDFTAWFGLFAPKDTSASVLSRLRQSLTSAVQDPDYRESITKLGSENVPSEFFGATALKSILGRDLERWRTLLHRPQQQ